MRVVVAGHVCADLTPALLGAPDLTPGRLTEVGPLAIAPGGAVANTGLALAAMGDDVRADALVGPDPLAGLIRAALTAGGVNADRLRQAPPAPAAEPAVPGMDDAGASSSGETRGTSYSIVVAGPGGAHRLRRERGPPPAGATQPGGGTGRSGDGRCRAVAFRGNARHVVLDRRGGPRRRPRLLAPPGGQPRV
ncbi:MAG: hypothetical protein LBM66_01380 [Bifidobacteriaceae bacterium]|jgi:hypothetical protein|nr:hypothetical protein [Bifidobacteriaceae bacterium]